MTSERRSRLEIYAITLDKARRPEAKTALVYGVNSNFAWLSEALTTLIAAGLIEKQDSRYITTDKGREWLKLYKQLAEAVQL